MPESDYGYHQYWDMLLSHDGEQTEIGEFESGSILVFALFDDLRQDFAGRSLIDIARDQSAYETAHLRLTNLVHTIFDTVRSRTEFANVANSRMEEAQIEYERRAHALENSADDDARRDDIENDAEHARSDLLHWTRNYEAAVSDLKRMEGLPTTLYEVIRLLESAYSERALSN